VSFFSLIEKNGERRAVYSKSDMDYMVGRGWKPVILQQNPVQFPVVEQYSKTTFHVEQPAKRKPGRPRKK
jgi:hypothetical protein